MLTYDARRCIMYIFIPIKLYILQLPAEWKTTKNHNKQFLMRMMAMMMTLIEINYWQKKQSKTGIQIYATATCKTHAQ